MSNKFSSRFTVENSKKSVNENEPEVIIAEQNSTIEPEIIENEQNIDMSEFKADLKNALYDRIVKTPVWYDYTYNERLDLIKAFIVNKLSENNIEISDDENDKLIEDLLNSVSDFASLDNLIENTNVDSVYVNSNKSVYIEIDNKILNPEITLGDSELNFILDSIKNMVKVNDFNGVKKFKTDNFVITIIGNDLCKTGINIEIDKCSKI